MAVKPIRGNGQRDLFKKAAFFKCVVLTLLCLLRLAECRSLSSDTVLAFAGGFGGGFGGGNSSPKKKKIRSKQRKGGLTEVPIEAPPSETTKVSTDQKFDKWGLPVATIDDIFPPMPPGTELIPIDTSREYSLEEIQSCLKDHLDMELDRFFDESGEEKVSDGRLPMKLSLLHKSPPVLAIDNFFTPEECSELKTARNSAHEVNSATFSGSLSTRTSTSWFCQYSDVPALLSKANQILSIPLESMEEPQIVRYKKGQEFSWHYDEIPKAQLSNGGQRLATLLIYLNDISPRCGGGTTFRDLELDSKALTMQPKCGSALLFFPTFRNGTPDDRTLHKSEVMLCDDEKWIVQMWIHEKSYQAVLPVGNSNEAARSVMEQVSRDLGYN
jgi:prolyl 4-hydroxylase